MAICPILQLGDPRLREVALPVEDARASEISALVTDLADTLAHWRSTTGYGRGIAAPQLGVRKRVIFLKLPGEQPWPLVNPEITGRSTEKIVVWDACLSEVDHLDGILAVDRIFDIKTLCTRGEFEKRYRAASPYATSPVTISS